MRRVVSLLALSVVLPIAAHAGGFQSGRGWVESIVGDNAGYAWSLSDGITGSTNRSSGIAPEFCLAVCTYDFSQRFAAGLLPCCASTEEFVVQASFVFTGPAVEATVDCRGSCPPGGFRNFYPTNWSDVPITMTGQVDLISFRDPRVVLHYLITGTGLARAETRWFAQDPGPWNYRLLRYDFTYEIVPEPRAVGLLWFGVVVVGVVKLRVRRPVGGSGIRATRMVNA